MSAKPNRKPGIIIGVLGFLALLACVACAAIMYAGGILSYVPALGQDTTATLSPEIVPLAGVGMPVSSSVERITADNANRVTLLTRLGNAVKHPVTWSRDGRTLAFFNSYGIYLFDAETLAQIRFIANPARIDRIDRRSDISGGVPYLDAVTAITFSPDGTLLASTSSTGKTRLMRVNDGSIVRELSGACIVSCFSPDGKLIATRGPEDSVQFWRVSDGALDRELKKLARDEGFFSNILLSPDWNVFAVWVRTAPPIGTPIDKPARLLRVSDGTILRELQYVGSGNLTFSPDGSLFLSSSVSYSNYIGGIPDQTSAKTIVSVWRVDDNSVVRQLTVPYRLTGYSISPDNSLLALADGSTVRLIRISDGNLAREIKGEGALPVFSPDGSLLASPTFLRLWRVSDASLARESKDWYPIGIVSFSSDTNTIAMTTNTGLRFLRGSDWNQVNELKGIIGSPVSSPDMRFVVTTSSEEAQLWRVADNTLMRQWKGRFWQVVFNSDSSLFAWVGTENWKVEVYRTSDASLVRVFQDSVGFNKAWFSPDGNLLAVRRYKGTLWLTRVSDGALVRELKAHTEGGVTFSPDNSLMLFWSDKETVQVTRVSDGAVVRELKIRSGNALTFSPNGNLVTESGNLYQGWVGDDAVRVWRVSDWSLVHELKGASGIPVFSPDGTLLATRASKELGLVQLWRASDGKLVREFKSQRENLTDLAFSQDGRLLMSVCADGTLAVWGIPGAK